MDSKQQPVAKMQSVVVFLFVTKLVRTIRIEMVKKMTQISRNCQPENIAGKDVLCYT